MRGLSSKECAKVFGNEDKLFSQENGGGADGEGGMVDRGGDANRGEVREIKETGDEGGEAAVGERV